MHTQGPTSYSSSHFAAVFFANIAAKCELAALKVGP